MTGNFQKLLAENGLQSMNIQGKIIEDAHVIWRGNQEQVDDICVIGVRV